MLHGMAEQAQRIDITKLFLVVHLLSKKYRMQDGVIVSVKLCSRTYRLKVDPKNEATVRKIVQEITEKMNTIKNNFPGRDEQDYLAMTLMDYITSMQEPKTNPASLNEDIDAKLQGLLKLLDE